jgi:hypothetical protein
MIQLASDPNSRPNWRPAAAEAKENPLAAARRSRSGHAWPFIVRQGERNDSAQEHQRANSTESGS